MHIPSSMHIPTHWYLLKLSSWNENTDGRTTDGYSDDQRETIIPRHSGYRVAGYKNPNQSVHYYFRSPPLLYFLIIRNRSVCFCTNEPQQQKTYIRACVPSEDSDQPAHSKQRLLTFTHVATKTAVINTIVCESMSCPVYLLHDSWFR